MTVSITDIKVKPLALPLKKPYIWSQGFLENFAVNLIEITASDGTVGLGECNVGPDQNGTMHILNRIKMSFINENPYDWVAIKNRIFTDAYIIQGTWTMRAYNQMMAGFDFAILDLIGKLDNRPIHQILGGAHRNKVGYFFFLQGSTTEEISKHAAEGFAAGERIFYLKEGRGEAIDINMVRAVRSKIGEARLRLDANEAWDPQEAIRMCRKLETYDIDFIEQPTPCWSIDALAHVRSSVGIPIVADQSAFTIYDVYEICQKRAADMICIGPVEIGGIQPMLKAAAIAEAAGLKICIHSSFSSGITTSAEYQIGMLIPNLDDGNQIMCQLLKQDLVKSPVLAPKKGWMHLPNQPGLGISLDKTVLKKATQTFQNLPN